MNGPFATNSFEKGWNSDFDVLKQPDGTYRYMKNCSLISQDGKNYVVKDCMGNVLTFTLNSPYNAVYTVTGTLSQSIGFISFPNKLIVFSTNSESTTGYGEIGMLMYKPYGQGIEAKDGSTTNFHTGYQVLYHHASLNFTKLHKIEGFGFPENDTIQRVYWTDNFNQPRVLDTADTIFTTYYATGSLTTGTQYMVLEGAITHNAVNYGPGLTAGNVFTAANANYTDLTNPTPTARVIKYYPVELLNWVPNRNLGNIKFSSYGVGSVNCGHKMYFYRVGKLSAGIYSSWSYGSAPIHVGMANVSSVLSGNAYHDFVGNGGATVTPVNSGKSVEVAIDNLDTYMDVIQLAVVEYDQSTTIPYAMRIVDQSTITSSSIIMEHLGTEDLGTLTLNDLTLFPASIEKVKTMTTNKNYSLIANITERSEFTDTITATIGQVQYPLIEQGDNDTCSNLQVFDALVPSVAANPGVNDILPNSRYVVSLAPDAANRVEYPVGSGTFYYTGDVFVGVTGSYTATFTGTAQARPCASLNKYTPITSLNPLTSQRKNTITFPNDTSYNFWDYKNPVVAQHVRGYWSNEKYRIGILCYDLKGNPFYVRHLGDYTFSTIPAKGGLMLSENSVGGSTQYSLNPSILTLDIVLPASIISQISGFSIVRAERDARILLQGITGRVVSNGGSPNLQMPEATIFYGPSLYTTAASDNVYTFVSPDYNVDCPTKKTTGVVGDKMEEAGWLGPYDFGGGVYYAATTADPRSLSVKFTESLAADAFSPRSVTLGDVGGVGWQKVDEKTYFTNWQGPSSNTDFYNVNQMSAANFILIDGSCSSVQDIGSLRGAAGGKKLIFKPTSNFNHYSIATSYSLVDQRQKILFNYCKNINAADQYGGSGVQAIADTLYISTGHYQPINATVKAETLHASGNYHFNGVQVAGGDCYTCWIDQVVSSYDTNGATGVVTPPSFGITQFFPCECNSNYNLRRGRKGSNSFAYPAGTLGQAVAYTDPVGNVRLEDYSYNPGYTAEGQNILYPGLPVNYVNSTRFPVRIRYAGVKFFGELIDSFRTYLTNNYKDLNGQQGEINNIRERDGRVLVWQNKSLNSVPVLERQLLGATSGAATTIGVGGVVDRFDPINSAFGNQHQHGLTETDYGFAWFDMRKKAFVVMDINGGVAEVSKIDGLKGYFMERFLENIGTTQLNADLLNDPTFNETSDRPLMGVGIVGVYDKKFDYTYMTFKFIQRYVPSEGTVSYLNKDFTVIYDHADRMFIGELEICPAIWHNHNGVVLSSKRPLNVQKYYGPSMPSTSFVVGDIVRGATNNKEYVCTANVTITTYDVTVNTDPTFTGTPYWTQTSSTDQLWVQNQPTTLGLATAPDYLYSKAYGIVIDQEVWFVVNPKTGEPVTIDSLEMKGNNVNYTDFLYSNDLDSASDLSVSSTNRDYQFINQSWWGTVPLGTYGRMVDNYLLVKLKKKNWTSNPTTLSVGVKILQFIKSYFRSRK